jgi:dihydrofolate synthase/folylpolyglutamate synthase
MADAKAFAELEADLNRRINPESSRRFSRSELEGKIDSLMRLGAMPEFRSQSGTVRFSIIGTNGKGSTAHLLARLLKGTVGLYTSPHLLSVLERIRLNGEPVGAFAALDALHELRAILGTDYERYSYFEILTLGAIRLFRRAYCDFEIYEAGLGGRFDATRLCSSQAVILTTISRDHTEVLGEKLETILTEKLHIMTESATHIFVMPLDSLGDEFVDGAVHSIRPNARLFRFPERFHPESEDYTRYNLQYARFITERLTQDGVLRPDQINRNTLEPTPLPGRLESCMIEGGKGPVTLLYDNAHNEEAFRVLLQNIRHHLRLDPERTLLLFASLPDRDPEIPIRLAHEAGFLRILQIVGEGFHAAPEGIVSLPVESAVDAIRMRLDEGELEGCIVTGSHRIYHIFNGLKCRTSKHI